MFKGANLGMSGGKYPVVVNSMTHVFLFYQVGIINWYLFKHEKLTV